MDSRRLYAKSWLPERLHDVQVCEAPEQLLSGSLDWRQPSLLLYMFYVYLYLFHLYIS